MKKQKENYFVNKFRLLDSQETNEEISWSCSDSSDYEDYTPSGKFNITYGKRKKSNRKRKELRNISNLDITIVDAINERKSCSKSPILVAKTKSEIKSPILTPSQSYLYRFNTKTTHNSPIPYNHIVVSKERRNLMSPILLKRKSPVISPKVKKKLFETAQCYSENSNVRTRSTSPVFNSNLDSLDRRKKSIPLEQPWGNNASNQLDKFRTERTKSLNEEQNIPNLKTKWKKTPTNQSHSYRISERIKSSNEEQDSYFNNDQKNSKFEINIRSSSSDSATNISREELVSKVKSYFNNYFSSQTSNHSISEYETPTPKSSSCEENDNINEITQVKSLSPSLKDTPTATSFGSNTNTIKQKAVKYKKGGLAYRLNGLLKKQNANISLWQHERFLAANSNFLIPKEENLAFRIKNVEFNYSIYSIDVVNEDDESFLIVINSTHVNNNQFHIDNILKLYKPYNIIECDNNCKIIVNVCKFECRKFI